MTEDQALTIKQGDVLQHETAGTVTARGSVSISDQWGAMVWVTTAGPYPLNAHISRLEFLND